MSAPASWALADNDSRHGSVNGYQAYHCRCDKCRAAWAANRRLRRAAGLEGKPGHRPTRASLNELIDKKHREILRLRKRLEAMP